MFNIIRKRKYGFIISGILVALSIAAIAFFGLRLGIDYTGGTLATYKTGAENAKQKIEQSFSDAGIESVQIKDSGREEFTVRTKSLSEEERNSLQASLEENISGIDEVKFDNIGPTIGRDLRNKSIWAVALASIGIIIFIAFSFRKVPNPLSSWKFGILAVVALLHDLLITTGVVAVLGHFYTWMEVDALFITALLTIMGFSVHDTIVVYDRLRENFIRNPHKSIEQSAEESVNQTLARSINTSLTTIFVLLALFILGGESIRHFVLTLIIGILIGTYSSIFLAAPALTSWHVNRGEGDA